MIVHTLLYRFPDTVSEQEREEFFEASRRLTDADDLVLRYDVRPHLWLPADKNSRGMTAAAIAQFSVRSLEDLRTFSEQPHVYDFTTEWKCRLNFEAAYANHEQIDLSA
jgi:Stress responsive A/B Barrel Domain